MTEDGPTTSRDQLRSLITELLVGLDLDEPSDESVKLERLCNEVLDGLNDLDAGETPEIFRCIDIVHRGPAPSQVKKLRLAATIHVEALMDLGVTHSDACEEIGKLFNRGKHSLMDWREIQKNDPLSGYRMAKWEWRSLERGRAFMKSPTTRASVIRAATVHGARFRALYTEWKK